MHMNHGCDILSCNAVLFGQRSKFLMKILPPSSGLKCKRSQVKWEMFGSCLAHSSTFKMEGDMFLRNVSWLSHDLCPRADGSSQSPPREPQVPHRLTKPPSNVVHCLICRFTVTYVCVCCGTPFVSRSGTQVVRFTRVLITRLRKLGEATLWDVTPQVC
jgi:hypothetical protein